MTGSVWEVLQAVAPIKKAMVKINELTDIIFARRQYESVELTHVFRRQQDCANYRLVIHFKFLIVGPDQKMVTKRP